MGFFDLFRKADEKWHKLNQALVQSFSRIKNETTLVFSWIHYLKEKDKLHDDRHLYHQQKLQSHGSLLENHHSQIEKIKDEIFALKSEILQLKISQEKPKVEPAAGSFPNLVRTKSEPKSEPAPRTYLEKTVLAKVRQQRKAYVIEQILKLIDNGVNSTKEIENVIVGEKGLCGRTAFYDYMREMKHRKMLKRKDFGEKKVLVTR
ncbi:MAG: hypothetical protein V1702_01330 [Candidatus Woesearchaeota archaeon]